MTRSILGNLRDLELRKTRRLTAGQLHHRLPSFSPDGKLILHALGSGSESHWHLSDRKGRVARVLAGPALGRGTISIDGSIAYGRQVGATCEIWLLAAGDNEPRRLFGGDGRLYRDPTFSPDGGKLAFLADEGSQDSQLRLWIYDLAEGKRELLLGSLPGHKSAQLLHPVWAPQGDSVFVEAHLENGPAVFELVIGTGQIVARTEPGYASPAPLARGLLLAEHRPDAGQSELVLLAYPPCADKPRQAVLLDSKAGGREPAAVWDKKGEVHVVFSMATPHDGEPQRSDLHIALLSKLPRRLQKLSDGDEPATEGDESDDEEADVVGQSARAASLPPLYDIWLSMERGA